MENNTNNDVLLSDDSSERAVLDVLEAREVLLEDEDRAKRDAMENYGLVLRQKEGPKVVSEIEPEVLPMLLRLPTTKGDAEKLRKANVGYEQWETALKKGFLPKSRSRSAKGGEGPAAAAAKEAVVGLARGRDVSGGTVGNVGRVGHGAIYEEVSAGFEDVDAEYIRYFVPVRNRDGRRGRGGSEFGSEAEHGEQSK